METIRDFDKPKDWVSRRDHCARDFQMKNILKTHFIAHPTCPTFKQNRRERV
jgi:hypothetical protein